MPLPLAVLVSGNGTNLQAILDAIGQGALRAEVRLVLSNVAGAGALARAERAGVPVRVLEHRAFASRAEFDRAVAVAVREAGAEWIVLAGFMRILGPEVVGAFRHRIVNLHPALLPAFPGAHAHRDALAYGVKVTGCTVHLVDEGVDTGPIVLQRAVPVLDTDDEASLAARVRVEEHALLVAALRAISEGRLHVEAPAAGGRARVRIE
ncbi:MAG: phosphoribosylglycinamide formyltransferase [Polyangiaceae bacterium]|nr:phosphoribosylglycinamide formyltransferase [Polyangiaceae bacterium]